MSIIKDTFFGGAEKDAAKAQQKGIEAGIDATKQAVAEAKAQINQLYPQAQQSLNQGYQGALDVFGQALPAQMQAFQQGNQQGQQTLFNSLPQIQNALLGGSLDFSQFAPQQQQMPDTSFFQQQLPQFGQAPQQQPQQQNNQQGFSCRKALLQATKERVYSPNLPSGPSVQSANHFGRLQKLWLMKAKKSKLKKIQLIV
mgnify:CR=1 FL=1